MTDAPYDMAMNAKSLMAVERSVPRLELTLSFG